MGGFRVVTPALLGVWVAGCASTDKTDLAENPALYRPTGYRAKVPADRAVFVAPVVDARAARAAEDASGSFVVDYFSDAKWDRPPVDMIDAVLRTELADSGVFTELVDRPGPEACVLRVELRRFDVGGESHVTGVRSFAALGHAVQVYGPGEGNGRALLLDEQLGDATASDIDWRPAPGAVLMGACLRRVNGAMLGLLDQRNVGRTGVPLGDASGGPSR
jgi:hypothetical protein